MNKWILIHTYNNLVEENKARAILCPDDQQILIPMIDTVKTDNEDPVLWCPACNHRNRPGITVWDQIEAVVKEHHDI